MDALLDPASGLPRLGASALQERLSSGGRLLLAEIALDRLGGLVDGFGEETAGRALSAMAARITLLAPRGTTLWRLRGAGFLLATEDEAALADPEAFAARLLAAIAEPLAASPYLLRLEASIGIAVHPDDAEGAAALLDAADRALSDAQRTGVGRVVRAPRRDLATGSVPAFTRALAAALSRDELELHYQPFVDAADGRIAGVEALLRWRSPDGGLLAPPQFLPRAEQLGLMRSISAWVLDRVIADARHWRRSGFDDLRIAVNVSTVQLLEDDLVDQLETRLAAADVPFSQ